MDIKKDINVVGASVTADEATSINKPKTKPSRGSGKGLKVVIVILVIAVLLVAAGYLVDRYTAISLLGGKEPIATSGYSAVFLSNGQVYFGIMKDGRPGYTQLEDIYYLQTYTPSLQQAPNQEAVGQPQLSLVKLGNELHGPKDKMEINNDHIVFIEELKKEGRVTEAIARYKEGQ